MKTERDGEREKGGGKERKKETSHLKIGTNLAVLNKN